MIFLILIVGGHLYGEILCNISERFLMDKVRIQLFVVKTLALLLMGAGYEYSQYAYIQTITDPSHMVRTRLRGNNTQSVCGSER